MTGYPSEEELRAALPLYDVVKTYISDPEYLREIDAHAPLEIVLRGHLWLERELAALVRLAVVEPKYLPDRMSFYSKLSLCRAQAVLPPDYYEPAVKLNELRNKVAHRAEYHVTEKDEQELLQSMPEIPRRDLMRLRAVAAEARGFPATLRFTISYLLAQFAMVRKYLEGVPRQTTE